MHGFLEDLVDQGELIHTGVGMLVLLVIQVLNVCKPLEEGAWCARKRRLQPLIRPAG